MCRLPPPRLTSQWLSASESCLSDKLRPRTCREAQTFPSCQSRWWTVEECIGQFAGLCEVCRERKSFLSVQQWGVSHHTQIRSTTDGGVWGCVCVCVCIYICRASVSAGVCFYQADTLQTAVTYQRTGWDVTAFCILSICDNPLFCVGNMFFTYIIFLYYYFHLPWCNSQWIRW